MHSLLSVMFLLASRKRSFSSSMSLYLGSACLPKSCIIAAAAVRSAKTTHCLGIFAGPASDCGPNRFCAGRLGLAGAIATVLRKGHLRAHGRSFVDLVFSEVSDDGFGRDGGRAGGDFFSPPMHVALYITFLAKGAVRRMRALATVALNAGEQSLRITKQSASSMQALDALAVDWAMRSVVSSLAQAPKSAAATAKTP